VVYAKDSIGISENYELEALKQNVLQHVAEGDFVAVVASPTATNKDAGAGPAGAGRGYPLSAFKRAAASDNESQQHIKELQTMLYCTALSKLMWNADDGPRLQEMIETIIQYESTVMEADVAFACKSILTLQKWQDVPEKELETVAGLFKNTSTVLRQFSNLPACTTASVGLLQRLQATKKSRADAVKLDQLVKGCEADHVKKALTSATTISQLVSCLARTRSDLVLLVTNAAGSFLSDYQAQIDIIDATLIGAGTRARSLIVARTQEDLLEALQALLEAAADPELTSEKRLEACTAWSKAATAVTASTKADKSYVELSKIERPDVMASFRQALVGFGGNVGKLSQSLPILLFFEAVGKGPAGFEYKKWSDVQGAMAFLNGSKVSGKPGDLPLFYKELKLSGDIGAKGVMGFTEKTKNTWAGVRKRMEDSVNRMVSMQYKLALTDSIFKELSEPVAPMFDLSKHPSLPLDCWTPETLTSVLGTANLTKLSHLPEDRITDKLGQLEALQAMLEPLPASISIKVRLVPLDKKVSVKIYDAISVAHVVKALQALSKSTGMIRDKTFEAFVSNLGATTVTTLSAQKSDKDVVQMFAQLEALRTDVMQGCEQALAGFWLHRHTVLAGNLEDAKKTHIDNNMPVSASVLTKELGIFFDIVLSDGFNAYTGLIVNVLDQLGGEELVKGLHELSTQGKDVNLAELKEKRGSDDAKKLYVFVVGVREALQHCHGSSRPLSHTRASSEFRFWPWLLGVDPL